MATGIAIYGVDRISVLDVFDEALRFFNELGYPITGAGYDRRGLMDGVDDIEFVEVSSKELKVLISEGKVVNFRVFSEIKNVKPWFSSFGYTTEEFGSFFCIDMQSDVGLEELNLKIKRFLISASVKLKYIYAIVYELASVSSAMSYARGQNFKTIYQYEDPVAFIDDASPLYLGGRQYEHARLRMIYPINFLNDQHLSIKIGSTSLLEWISESPSRGVITKVLNGWCWEVGREYIDSVNEICGKAGTLLAWKPKKAETKKKLPG
jgi:hypothetical protein